MDKIDNLLQALEKNRNSLSTDRLDMSFGEIINMYEKGELVIDPEFQRLFRWSEYQKTRLIESILIGIPIPPIFVAEDTEGRWELVDGLQRLSTLLSFFSVLKSLDGSKDKNGWLLTSGDLLEELEGLACKDLPLKLQLNIKRASCRIEIIKWNSGFDMRYELFNRLNTGGSDLTDQEIRNAIFRATARDFNNFISASSKNTDFINLIDPTDRQKEQLYMDELVLRFCTLYDYSYLEKILNENKSNKKNKIDKKNISQLMTTYMRNMAGQDVKIKNLSSAFNRTISLLKPIGKKVFRPSNNVFSTSLYDCVIIGVSKNIDFYEAARTDELISRIEALKVDQDFKKSSGSASASQSRILKRIEVANKIFSQAN